MVADMYDPALISISSAVPLEEIVDRLLLDNGSTIVPTTNDAPPVVDATMTLGAASTTTVTGTATTPSAATQSE